MDLPDDIIATICFILLEDHWGILSILNDVGLQYLNLALVCKKWNKILKERIQFQSIRFSTITRDTLVKVAEAANDAKLYDEFYGLICKAFSRGPSLSVQERELFEASIRNCSSSRTYNICVLSRIKDSSSTSVRQQKVLEEYLRKLQAEAEQVNNQLIKTLERCISQDENAESKSYLFKLLGKLHRNASNIHPNFAYHLPRADEAFAKGLELACSNLPMLHSTRVGLYVAYSTFCFENLNQPEKAIDLAKTCLNNFVECHSQDHENPTRDTCDDYTWLHLGLLRDNLTLWTSTEQELRDE